MINSVQSALCFRKPMFTLLIPDKSNIFSIAGVKIQDPLLHAESFPRITLTNPKNSDWILSQNSVSSAPQGCPKPSIFTPAHVWLMVDNSGSSGIGKISRTSGLFSLNEHEFLIIWSWVMIRSVAWSLQEVSSVRQISVICHWSKEELKSMATEQSKARKEMTQATRILRTVRLQLMQLHLGREIMWGNVT